jgi:hypothetical protein
MHSTLCNMVGSIALEVNQSGFEGLFLSVCSHTLSEGLAQSEYSYLLEKAKSLSAHIDRYLFPRQYCLQPSVAFGDLLDASETSHHTIDRAP